MTYRVLHGEKPVDGDYAGLCGFYTNSRDEADRVVDERNTSVVACACGGDGAWSYEATEDGGW